MSLLGNFTPAEPRPLSCGHVPTSDVYCACDADTLWGHGGRSVHDTPEQHAAICPEC